MTDNEIIKALECCISQKNCEENCPYSEWKINNFCCIQISTLDAIELINRQEKELEDKFEIIGQQGRYIKGLKEENKKIKTNIYKMAIDKALAEKARVEAIKEFADKLKEKAYPFPCAIGVEYAVSVRAINELADFMCNYYE